jgi:hypothetical protein
MRQFQPERVSPFRMPGWFRWVALACALFLTFDYVVGGWNSPNIVVGPGTGHFLYILGLIIVAAYVPLYFWRKLSDKRRGVLPMDDLAVVLGSPGGIDFDDTGEPVVLEVGGPMQPAMPAGSAMALETES